MVTLSRIQQWIPIGSLGGNPKLSWGRCKGCKRALRTRELPGQWWSHHPVQGSKGLQMWHLGQGLGVNRQCWDLILKIFSNLSNFI